VHPVAAVPAIAWFDEAALAATGAPASSAATATLKPTQRRQMTPYDMSALTFV
jgi:hypothetical protein